MVPPLSYLQHNSWSKPHVCDTAPTTPRSRHLCGHSACPGAEGRWTQPDGGEVPRPTPQPSLRAPAAAHAPTHVCTQGCAHRAANPPLSSTAQSTDSFGASSTFGAGGKCRSSKRGRGGTAWCREWKKEPCAPYVLPRSATSSQDGLLHVITTRCFGTGPQHDGRRARERTATEAIFLLHRGSGMFHLLF